MIALGSFPALAHAAAGAAQPADAPAPAPEGGGEQDVVIMEDEMEGEQPAPPTGDGGGPDLGGLLGGEGEEGKPDATQAGAGEGEAAAAGPAEADSEENQIKTDQGLITVVQRQRMLKRKRFDLQPQFGISINDPYVRHYVLGAELNYWLTNRMAIGLAGHGFIGARTPRYANVRIQEGVLLTANEVLWQASLQYTYNPFYGKIAIFNRALLHWEAYVQVGGGAIQTQVIPRFEALHEPFTNLTGQGNLALGARFYLPAPINWISVNAGVRHFMYPDLLEPFERGPTAGATVSRDDLDDPDVAKDNAERVLGQTTMAFIGVSFYFPTKFEYSTQR
jgi:outer membrane beta-barrel protein